MHYKIFGGKGEEKLDRLLKEIVFNSQKLLPQASVLRDSSNRFFYLYFLILPEESQADHAHLMMKS